MATCKTSLYPTAKAAAAAGKTARANAKQINAEGRMRVTVKSGRKKKSIYTVRICAAHRRQKKKKK